MAKLKNDEKRVWLGVFSTGEFIFFAILLLVIFAFAGLAIVNIHWETVAAETYACDELAGWTLEDLPVRCYEYFELPAVWSDR